MKKLLLLLLFPVLVFAQTAQVASGPNTFNSYALKQTYNGTTYSYSVFQGKTFTATTDTLAPLSGIDQFKTLYLVLQSKDSVSALIYERFSSDGGTWSGWNLRDSLKQSTDTSVVKSYDFTARALGASAVQFRINVNALAYALGTTTPTYSIRWVLKKF